MKKLRLRSEEQRKTTLAGAVLKGAIRLKPRVEFAKYRLTSGSELSSAQEYKCARRVAISGSADDMLEMLRYRRRDIAQERIAEGLLARFSRLVEMHNGRMKELGSTVLPGVIAERYMGYVEKKLASITAMVESAAQILNAGALTSEQAKRDLRAIRDDISKKVIMPFPAETLISAIIIVEDRFDVLEQRKQREVRQMTDPRAIQGIEEIFDELEGITERKRRPEDMN